LSKTQPGGVVVEAMALDVVVGRRCCPPVAVAVDGKEALVVLEVVALLVVVLEFRAVLLPRPELEVLVMLRVLDTIATGLDLVAPETGARVVLSSLAVEVLVATVVLQFEVPAWAVFARGADVLPVVVVVRAVRISSIVLVVCTAVPVALTGVAALDPIFTTTVVLGRPSVEVAVALWLSASAVSVGIAPSSETSPSMVIPSLAFPSSPPLSATEGMRSSSL